jgi:class 3 adenylate cyclase
MAEAAPPDGEPPETPTAPDLSPAGPRPTPPAAPHLTRGFLFADLRDYTGYVETHGDRAGAALLARYRGLVREVVAAAAGAEIRTEGDSFYVVFDSASAAVGCGLAIIEAAAATAAEPDPIRVGVGVHAGETVETAEGFVGSAVNLAARLCAEAKDGEVVVSETVRGLTRTQIEVEFQPLGSRRLKGVPEPVACYRVVARDAAAPGAPATRPAGRRPSALIAAGLGLAVLIAVAAVGVALLGGGRAAAPTPGPSAVVAGSPAGASASPGSSAGGSPAVASASPGPFPNAVEAAILAALPPALAQTCVRGGTPNDASLAGFTGFVRVHMPAAGPDTFTSVTPTGSRGGVTCHPATGATRLYVMQPATPSVEYYLGSGGPSAPGDVYLGFLASVKKLPFGSCSTDKRAQEMWFGPSGSGMLACMNPYDGRPWIYITFGKGRYLGFATRDDSNYAALYQWWEQLKIFLP